MWHKKEFYCWLVLLLLCGVSDVLAAGGITLLSHAIQSLYLIAHSKQKQCSVYVYFLLWQVAFVKYRLIYIMVYYKKVLKVCSILGFSVKHT